MTAPLIVEVAHSRRPRWNAAVCASPTARTAAQIASFVPRKSERAVGYSVPVFEPRVGALGVLCALHLCTAAPYRNGLCGTHFMDVWRDGAIVRPPVRDTCRACGSQLVRSGSRQRTRLCAGKQCKSLHERYGVTPPTYALLMAATTCDACGDPASYGGQGSGVLVVDHDHKTGAVRGFIDSGCNLALGLAGDRPALLIALATFLETGVALAPAEVPSISVGPSNCPMCAEPKAISLGYKPATYCGPICRRMVGGIKRHYGLLPPQYLWLRQQRPGLCWGCNEPFSTADYLLRPVLDHDHETGGVRGLVHERCNAALSRAGDSPQKLRALAAYLELAA